MIKATIARGVSIMALTAMTFAIAAPVAAQDNEAASDENVILVTAQFREQDLQDTPIAITAISGDMLDARSQSDVQQIAAQAPNVNLQPGTGSFGPSLAASIRGVGQYDFSPAVEPGVGFYVDDVYYPSLTGAVFDLLDLDRIEILRGPQGTLAGRNSIGGAVKLYSRRPEGDNTGMISAGYGSRDRVDFRGGFDFGITDDLSARISGAAKQQGGYVDVLDYGCVNPLGSANNPTVGGIAPTRAPGDCRVARDGDVNYQALRGQLRYHPSSSLDLMLSAEYISDNRRPSPAILIATNGALTPAQQARVRGSFAGVNYDNRFICGLYCNYATGRMPIDTAQGFGFDTSSELFMNYEGIGLSLNADIDLTDDLKLTSITGYRDFSSQFVNDADLSPLAVNQGYNDLNVKFFSQEVRLTGSLLDDSLVWTLGGYYSDQDTFWPYVQDLRVSGLQFASLGEDVEAVSFAAFAHVSWELMDGLTFNGGLRRTHERKDYQFSRRFIDGRTGVPRVGSLDGLVGTYTETRWDYRANLQYEFTADVMAYVQYSTGYKGGGINPRPFFDTQVQPFTSEALTAYEVGLKADLIDGLLRVNTSAFFNDYTNIQLVLTSCPNFTPNNALTPCAMTSNAGDAHVKGFEVETTINPADGFSIDATLSYLDFQYTSLNAAVTGVSLANVAPYTNEWKWSIGAQYVADLPGGSTLTPRLDLSHQSQFFVAASNSAASRVPAYTLLNGRVTWRNADDDLDVSLQVTNLTDKYYYQGAFENLQSGFAVAQPARPREWAVSVTKRF
ncbi:MAG: TonB-dependent receptor [Alteraurantiacibacter sp.]